ncbi:LLM class flavin-dependent oxidoreductase, partial [Kribbella sp. NPDC002412]
AWSSAYSRTRGVFPPLEPVRERDMTEKERGFFEQSLRGQIYGTPDEVDSALGGLVRRTAADEVLLTTSTYDRSALLRTYDALAELAGTRSTVS